MILLAYEVFLERMDFRTAGLDGWRARIRLGIDFACDSVRDFVVGNEGCQLLGGNFGYFDGEYRCVIHFPWEQLVIAW